MRLGQLNKTERQEFKKKEKKEKKKRKKRSSSCIISQIIEETLFCLF